MNTKQRTEIFADLSVQDLLSWVTDIEKTSEVKVLKKPKMALSMMRARESVKQQLFNVGEVLISECTVSVDGYLGYGVALNQSYDKAEAMAIMDAIIHSNDDKWTELVNNMNTWLQVQSDLQAKAKRQEFSLIQSSLIQFEMMNESEEEE